MRVDDVLERTTAYYESVLWDSELGESILARLSDQGVNEDVLRTFRVGYAPGEWTGLLDHLAQWDFSDSEMDAAGVADRSDQGRLHVHFRSRVMFPVRDRDGRALGFAGLATNPGPSWPQWITSPDGERYQRRTALFALEVAAPAIAEAGEALVLKDCLDVLRHHQDGRREAVAAIRSNVTEEHLAQIAEVLSAEPSSVGLAPLDAEGMSGARVLVGGSRPGGAQTEERERSSANMTVPDAERPLSPGERALLILVSIVTGVGLPIVWMLLFLSTVEGADRAEQALVPAVGGVAVSYALLTMVGAAVTARLTARSRARRMRPVWELGSTEWQPPAWTYHRLEEVLIGSALISIVVCVATFLAIGGFG